MMTTESKKQNEVPILKDFSHPFAHFNLGLALQEQKSLSDLKITKTNSLRLYGALENTLSQINKLLQDTGASTKTALEVAQIIVRFIQQVIHSLGAETAVIDMRAFTPTDQFDTPRWHTDGIYYPENMEEDKPVVKVVAALLGPQTLFYRLPDEKRSEFVALDNDRQRTGAMIQTLGNDLIESSRSDEGTVFIAGPCGAVHSEPPIKQNRLFVAVVPCSKKQCDEMQKIDTQAQTDPDIQAQLEIALQKMFPGARQSL